MSPQSSSSVTKETHHATWRHFGKCSKVKDISLLSVEYSGMARDKRFLERKNQMGNSEKDKRWTCPSTANSGTRDAFSADVLRREGKE